MLTRLRFFAAQALSGLWRSLGVTLLSVVTIALALGLVATFAIVIDNLSVIVDRAGREVGVSAYLDPELEDPRGVALATEVAAWPGVARAEYVTSTAALAWLDGALGAGGAVLEGLPPTVLPPALELQLERRAWKGDEIDKLAARLSALEGVESIDYGREDIERVGSLLGFIESGSAIVGLALCLAAILIVSNTVRIAVYARRDEIEIMSLIGATAGFVRTPFVIEGAVQGLLGGGLALLAMHALRAPLERGVGEALGYAFGPIEIHFLPPGVLLALLGAGGFVGIVGSAISVGRFIRI